MGKPGALALAIFAGCGGGGGQVDPASQDACLLWANGVCRLAYLCVDTSSRDAAFQARYGPDSDNCFQGLLGRCTSNQPADDSFGPSCGPGKMVSQTALQSCENNLLGLSCADWQGSTAGGCENICVQAVKDAGSGPAMTLADFCVGFVNLACDHSFACDPSQAASEYGSVSACKASLTSVCRSDPSALCPTGFDGSFAATCLAEYGTAVSCTILSVGASQIPSCDKTCKF